MTRPDGDDVDEFVAAVCRGIDERTAQLDVEAQLARLRADEPEHPDDLPEITGWDRP